MSLLCVVKSSKSRPIILSKNSPIVKIPLVKIPLDQFLNSLNMKPYPSLF